jgi:V8-like Glu-specific endopeptidase
MLRKSFALSIAAFLATFPNSVLADNAPSLENNKAITNSTSPSSYWTAERFKNAKPLTLIPQPHDSTRISSQSSTVTEASQSRPGQPPSVSSPANQDNLLYTPNQTNINNSGQVQPNNFGTAGALFSSSRLVPLTADQSYPYRTVGKLFFTIPGKGDYLCSASVIAYRIVLTAGHCVHSGNGLVSGYYQNFVFVPAYRDGVAPFQEWDWSYVITTLNWFSGNGVVPNAADYAMIEIKDKNYYGVRPQRIGDIVGYLGYRTNALIPNHATLLGYPGNLDSGEKMHQVTAQSLQSTIFNTAEYGSDMGEGASGGPWIQNFGVVADGQTYGLNNFPNQVIGVTSYGYTNPNVLTEGSSILDSRFTSLFTQLCSHQQKNC